jgi:formamidopyrimidine-DNA glycosylase
VPELPEVEVTRQRIEPWLLDREIRRVETHDVTEFWLTPPEELRRRLRGRRVERLDRHGKYLIARLHDGARLLVHLGMTGQLFAEGAHSVRLLSANQRRALGPEQQIRFRPDRHTHLRISFRDGGPRVLLRDVRRFGKVRWIAPGAREPRLERLGVDALAVTGELLHARTRRRTLAIKNLLLDQAVLAGVGNIYADEALHIGGVRPTRRAGRLSRAECERVAEGLRQVLSRSIETGGSSISDFIGPDGVDGAYQDERRVYARGGEPCARCGAPIRRIVLGQRGTHYCPTCQR